MPSYWVVLDEVDSTQRVAAEYIARGQSSVIVFANHQAQGRGRFDRAWLSARGESLTFSLAFGELAEHPMPWLIGMAVACACAGCLDCHVQWPNDLCLDGRKLGGILTELVSDRRVPVVGVGINLGQRDFPDELRERATSLRMAGRAVPDPRDLAERIVEGLRSLPEPASWNELKATWMARDASPGKRYVLPDGRVGVARSIDESGALVADLDNETVRVFAADAWYR